MLLPFSTHFQDESLTYFVENIWSGIRFNDQISLYDSLRQELTTPPTSGWPDLDLFLPNFQLQALFPKIQSLCQDLGRLWQVGMPIHPVLFTNTPAMWQFAEMLCTGIQELEMELYEEGRLLIGIDERLLDQQDFEVLATNEGFDTLTQFVNWYAPLCQVHPNRKWKGRLIHWDNIIRY